MELGFHLLIRGCPIYGYSNLDWGGTLVIDIQPLGTILLSHLASLSSQAISSKQLHYLVYKPSTWL
jgi:hypothetical protein